MVVRRHAVSMRTSDFHLNASQILAAARTLKAERANWLRRLKQRGVGNKDTEQGRSDYWVPFPDGVFLCQVVGLKSDLEPLLSYPPFLPPPNRGAEVDAEAETEIAVLDADTSEQQSEHDTGLRYEELESDTSDSDLSEQSQEPLMYLHKRLEHEETEYEPSELGNFISETGSKIDTKQSRHSMYSEPSYSRGSFLPRMKDSVLDQPSSDTRVQPHQIPSPHCGLPDQEDNESFSILQKDYPALPLQKGEKMRYISDPYKF